jgi:hypothetical protein
MWGHVAATCREDIDPSAARGARARCHGFHSFTEEIRPAPARDQGAVATARLLDQRT